MCLFAIKPQYLAGIILKKRQGLALFYWARNLYLNRFNRCGLWGTIPHSQMRGNAPVYSTKPTIHPLTPTYNV